jgi:perosamine synthetase
MIHEILTRIRNRFPPPIVLSQHPPQLQVDRVIERIRSILETGQFLNHEELSRLQETLSQLVGTKYCVLTNSGTSALHLALRLVDVKPGDEVFVPALSYIAPTNVVLYQGAIPHLYDIHTQTLQVDVDKLATTFQLLIERTKEGPVNRVTRRPIKACIIVHTVGYPSPVQEVVQLCREYQISVIEDIAEALGTYYRGQHVGSFGDIACLSFNVNKVVTGGGGGALLTNHQHYYTQAVALAQVGRTPHPWRYLHHRIGYNYGINAIQAAIINVQMEQLDLLLKRKWEIHAIYRSLLDGIKGVSFLEPIPEGKPNYWLNCIAIDPVWQEELLKKAHENGMDFRAVWTPVHHMEPYRKKVFFQNLNGADEAARKFVLMPSGYNLLRETE